MALATNKKALFDYELLEKFEAGLVLKGYEAKSIKAGQLNLKGSYVTFDKNQAYISHMHISKYKPSGHLLDYIPDIRRKLLLKKKEIGYLQSKSEEKGLTIIPTKVYTKNRFIKVEIAVARGKKLFDKRESIKKRELDREFNRTLKNS